MSPPTQEPAAENPSFIEGSFRCNCENDIEHNLAHTSEEKFQKVAETAAEILSQPGQKVEIFRSVKVYILYKKPEQPAAEEPPVEVAP